MDQFNRPPASASSARRHSEAAAAAGTRAAAASGKPTGAGGTITASVVRDAEDFESILFLYPERYALDGEIAEPACFSDLNLDQVVDAATATRGEYDLKGYFHICLGSVDEVSYRHEILRDLEEQPVLSHVRLFADAMHAMREHLVQAGKLYNGYQRDSWFLDAVEIYCRAVGTLAAGLEKAALKSRGMRAFRAHLQAYIGSKRFTSLTSAIAGLKRDLTAIRYCIYFIGDGFRVHRYRQETDYSVEIEQTFAKFRQGDAKDYRSKLPDWIEMNHVEEKVLEFVGRLWPEPFERLEKFYATESGAFADERVSGFDRQVQFYLAWLEYIEPLKQQGLHFCYPRVSDRSKAVKGVETFDLALAHKLETEKKRVVCNDFSLRGKERILVVSGPNQGGKTTFSRTFGQMHHLASLGLTVPGREAQLFLFDRLFTHFEREEDISNLRGKLQDDLVRVHEILEEVTPRSIVITNEIFTSTTLQDATFLSEKVMRVLVELDLICVWVTFIHELSTFSDKTVSMVSIVDPDNPAIRTFRVERQKASGRSYAMSIAEKYGLTQERLKERIQ